MDGKAFGLDHLLAQKSPRQNHRTNLLVRSIAQSERRYFGSMRKRRDVDPVDLDDRLTVTIQRTADVLDIGRSTVYELLRAGKLKGVKFGRAHRIVVQSIRDLVAES